MEERAHEGAEQANDVAPVARSHVDLINDPRQDRNTLKHKRIQVVSESEMNDLLDANQVKGRGTRNT